MKLSTKPHVVRMSVPRQGGGYLVVAYKGGSGASSEPIPEGAQVRFVNGQAERVR